MDRPALSCWPHRIEPHGTLFFLGVVCEPSMWIVSIVRSWEKQKMHVNCNVTCFFLVSRLIQVLCRRTRMLSFLWFIYPNNISLILTTHLFEYVHNIFLILTTHLCEYVDNIWPFLFSLIIFRSWYCTDSPPPTLCNIFRLFTLSNASNYKITVHFFTQDASRKLI